MTITPLTSLSIKKVVGFQLLLFYSVICTSIPQDTPALSFVSDSSPEFLEGENALLMCVVSNIGSNTVIWSKVVDGKKRILTIDSLRVVNDDRITVLHNAAPAFNSTTVIKPGGDVWLLSIRDMKKSDAGGYICRVNSIPALQTFYAVSIRSANASESSNTSTELRSSHNYTECCQEHNVAPECLGFCTIHDILEGSTGIEPEKCEKEFYKIVRCMADRRNHVPCCSRQGIPDICQDLCRGEYTMQDDYVQTHFSCTSYTEATLICISEGIEILPEQPSSVIVEVLGPDLIAVNWSSPRSTSPLTDNFIVNVTHLKKFSYPVDGNASAVLELDNKDDFRLIGDAQPMLMEIPGNATSVMVRHLNPLSWYEISVTAENSHGVSIPTYRIRTLTHDLVREKIPLKNPKLPDVVGCCVSKGVKHERCIYNLCNPRKRFIEEPDMIVCAAWTQEAFSCLANGIDHSDCCRARGLPGKCVELCSGNITKIDFTYFKCVDYFSDFRSCLMKGYGVLPGPPSSVQVSNVHSTFALLSWSPPKENFESISSYHAYYKPINPTSSCAENFLMTSSGAVFQGAYISSPPYVLENLCEDTEFELYVQAFNTHGISDPSERILFTTDKEVPAVESFKPYNVSECCQFLNLSPACMEFCNHNPRMSHVQNLAHRCKAEIPGVMKCLVGGRDHIGCCQRRGVPGKCLMQCRGAILPEEGNTAACLPYYGNIMLCLEEGMGVLPGPVTSLHATGITNNSVTLQWVPPADGPEVSQFQVHFQEAERFSSTRLMYSLNQTLNVTDPVVTIKELKNSSLYSFFVIAMNEWGASLPSSVLTINLTKSRTPDDVVVGAPSSPHSLVLEGKTATSLTVIWQPPAVSLPTDRFSYQVFHAMMSDSNEGMVYNKTVTATTAILLHHLLPNSQYMFFIVAANDKGASRPSETLVAWTDPAYPALVETPSVHPINLVVEGGTMTVLCIAMGSPPPKVSLYISGKLVHEDVTRHMVTVVKNVTRDMTAISCYADNGYGTPMQTSISISISHRPSIMADQTVHAIRGTDAILECRVEAWPEPSLVWWKNPENREPVIHGGNITLETVNVKKGVSLMRLKVKNSENSEYFCHATNALGSQTQKIKLETTAIVRMPLNISKCCQRNNVSRSCLMACDFDQIDFHVIMGLDHCIADFAKILQCGSDGSDHRGCCSKGGVPYRCLDWCRGKHVDRVTSCPLLWAPKIFECFGEGHGTLPGPPLNVRFQSASETSARISWDLPAKNPSAVELYRVFWRAKGTQIALRNDTLNRSIVIDHLKEGVEYEVAVKAGNHMGTSVLTATEVFKHSLAYVVSSQSTTASHETGVAVGVVFGLILLVCICGAGLWFLRKRRLMNKGNNGISFENPSYNRKQSADTVQIAETPNGSLNGSVTTPNGVLPSNAGTSNGGFPDMPNGGSVWNTHAMGSSTPGFEDDVDSKGGYTRMKS